MPLSIFRLTCMLQNPVLTQGTLNRAQLTWKEAGWAARTLAGNLRLLASYGVISNTVPLLYAPP
jgi:hypothetical protein